MKGRFPSGGGSFISFTCYTRIFRRFISQFDLKRSEIKEDKALVRSELLVDSRDHSDGRKGGRVFVNPAISSLAVRA
jgi:hypothetical protein